MKARALNKTKSPAVPVLYATQVETTNRKSLDSARLALASAFDEVSVMIINFEALCAYVERMAKCNKCLCARASCTYKININQAKGLKHYLPFRALR
jgi:hypothetical protein